VSLAHEIAETKVARGQVAFWGLGQAGFAFKASNGTIVYVDPYLSDACKRLYNLERMVPVLVPPREVRADFVLATHHHADHLDPDAFPEIAQANAGALLIGPPTCTQMLRKLGVPQSQTYTLNHGESLSTRGIRIHAVFAYHVWGDADDAPDGVGYVLDFGDVRSYISGDTMYHPHLAEAASLSPDLAFVCINGRGGNMSASEAAMLVRALNPQAAIPTHYDMFASNTADPQDFIKALATLGAPTRVLVVKPGQRTVFTKD
jgi:L-ascorbate 6-phosphate lactonase